MFFNHRHIPASNRQNVNIVEWLIDKELSYSIATLSRFATLPQDKILEVTGHNFTRTPSGPDLTDTVLGLTYDEIKDKKIDGFVDLGVIFGFADLNVYLCDNGVHDLTFGDIMILDALWVPNIINRVASDFRASKQTHMSREDI